MASVTVRNLSDEVHRALRVRAAHHGRSTEAEIRAILKARRPGRPSALSSGSLLTSIAREAGALSDAEARTLRPSSATKPRPNQSALNHHPRHQHHLRTAEGQAQAQAQSHKY